MQKVCLWRTASVVFVWGSRCSCSHFGQMAPVIARLVLPVGTVRALCWFAPATTKMKKDFSQSMTLKYLAHSMTSI